MQGRSAAEDAPGLAQPAIGVARGSSAEKPLERAPHDARLDVDAEPVADRNDALVDQHAEPVERPQPLASASRRNNVRGGLGITSATIASRLTSERSSVEPTLDVGIEADRGGVDENVVVGSPAR